MNIDPTLRGNSDSSGPFITKRRRSGNEPHLHPGASDDGRGPLVEQKRLGVGTIMLVILAVALGVIALSPDARSWASDTAQDAVDFAQKTEQKFSELEEPQS